MYSDVKMEILWRVDTEIVQAIGRKEYNIYTYISDGKIVKYDTASLIKWGCVFSVHEDIVKNADCLTVLNHTTG